MREKENCFSSSPFFLFLFFRISVFLFTETSNIRDDDSSVKIIIFERYEKDTDPMSSILKKIILFEVRR